jgi:hypothetical protein
MNLQLFDIANHLCEGVVDGDFGRCATDDQTVLLLFSIRCPKKN